MTSPSRCYVYAGALHIHTTYSHDGTGTFSQVIEAARGAGLSWIIVTDHDTLEGRHYEGWHDGVLVIVGHEITPRHNHFLAIGVDQVIDRNQHPQDFIDDVYRQGGFGIIAHPDDDVTNAIKKNTYAWDDWNVDGPRVRDSRTVGIELWNLLSDWGSHLTHYNKYLNFFFLRRGLRGPTPNALAWWDRLNAAGKRTFGVAGVDAHATRRRAPWGGTVEVFSYARTFRTLTNYLLFKEPLASDVHLAQRQVFDALMQGRLFFANRMEGDPSRITFAAERANTRWHIGETLTLNQGPVTLMAEVGNKSSLRILGNGQEIAHGRNALHCRIDTPGAYRLEVYHRSGRPWIFTNPIYMLPPD